MLLSSLAFMRKSLSLSSSINNYDNRLYSLGSSRFSISTKSLSSNCKNNNNDSIVDQAENREVKKKPDLRRAGKSLTTSNRIIVVACILVVVYMYPMIIKPLFGLGSIGDKQSKVMKEAGIDLSKHRPSFMPEWGSGPFGPKKDDD